MSRCIRFFFRPQIVWFLPTLFMLWMANTVQAQTAIALVQHAGKDGGTTTTTSLAFPSANTAGNWIAVCARGGFSSSQVFTISDSNGNLYRRAAQVGFTGSAVTLAVFYAENIVGGTNTVTVSDTVSAPLRIVILEYSGVATSNSLDAATAGTGTSASPGTPGLTTSANGDLLLASIATTNPASFTAGSGDAVSDFVPAEPNTKLVAEERMQSTAGPASAGASLSASDSWGAVLAAVKAASQGTGSAPPSITSLSPASGSAGTSVTITGANFGSTQNTSSVQFNGATATPASWSDSSIIAPVPSGATNGNVVVTVGGVESNGMSFTVTTSAVAPSITAQPSNQTITAGQTAKFTVSASGTAPLSYQWQKNGANISGATSSSYTTPATTTSDSGSTFDVIVSNSAGTATSNTATLTVNASTVAPAITTQPSNQTVTAGQAATFTVTANGTAPLSYQWQKNGANISGATSSGYTTPATTTSDNGSTFDVVVSNSAGSVTSSAATLTVNAPVAPTFTSQPANETVIAGQTATFTVTASGTAPFSYQWQQNGTDIPGATSSSYTTPATTSSDSGSTFDVIVSNSLGTVTSNAATLTVNATTANTSSWTYVQDSIDTFCNAGSSSCTIQVGTFLPTVPGSIWAVLLTTNNNVTITSVIGGGGTWTLCPNCHVFSSALSRNEDIAYNLTGNAGTTSITVNLSGAASGQFGLNFVELIPPPGATASFDDAGTAVTTSCTTCTGVGLNISATDVIIQSVAATSPSTWNAWSTPYTTLPLGEGLNLNATSGAAPTVLTTGPGAVFSAIAFKSTAGSFTPPAQPISVVNYTAPQGIDCNPSCSLSIPPTGAGHLLYIEAADMTSSRISSISTAAGSWVIPTGSNTCQITLSGGNALSCGYVLSSAAGVASLSVTMSGNANASFAIWELASASGSFSFDVEGAATNSPSFDPRGVALALSGSNDVIFQSAFVPGGTSAVSFYPMPRVPPGGQGTMFMNSNAASVVLLNTTNGAAPLWVNQQNNATVVSAVAFSTP